MDERIDVVLPLVARDLERFEILKASLAKFWRVPGNVFVICPDRDAVDVAKATGSLLTMPVIKESVLLEGRNEARSDGMAASGWVTQQLIKLAAHEIVESEFYLTMDADCFLVREVAYQDLVKDRRGYAEVCGPTLHSQWYEGAMRILGVPRPTYSASVTPFLMHREIARSLTVHLNDLALDNLSLLGEFPCWIDHLLSETGWTEYTLYHTHAHAEGLWKERYWPEHTPLLGNCVWYEKDFATWSPEKSFDDRQKNFLFTVIQSNTGIAPSLVWERVRRYLQLEPN